MEDNIQEKAQDISKQPQDVSKNKKKVKLFGIPIALFITVMCIVIVVATTITLIYTYVPSTMNFTKTLLSNPANTTSGTRNVYVSVTTSGDATNGILNCETENCSANTNDITLTNTDPLNAHTCIITTIGSNLVDIFYTNIGNNMIRNDTSTINEVSVTVQPNSSIPFDIKYSTNSSGSFPISTTENCP